MKNNTYNGWTNYATWRVNLEVFDGWDNEGCLLDADDIKELAEDIIFRPYSKMPSLAEDYARAFLSDVNWYEIAEAINERVEA